MDEMLNQGAEDTTRKRLTPIDVQQKVFRRSAFRGYHEQDVDDFLDEMTEELALLLDEVRQLRERTGVQVFQASAGGAGAYCASVVAAGGGGVPAGPGRRRRRRTWGAWSTAHPEPATTATAMAPMITRAQTCMTPIKPPPTRWASSDINHAQKARAATPSAAEITISARRATEASSDSTATGSPVIRGRITLDVLWSTTTPP